MIKLKHFVRASILTLTLAGGLAMAGNALAYDAADLAAAQAAVTDAQQAVDDDNGNIDYIAWQQADADSYYASAPYFCQFWTEGYMQCMYDVEDWYNAQTAYLNQQKADIQSQRDGFDQPALDEAIAWYDIVAGDQNGQSGVP
jgi:hypothetical protein